MASRSLLSSPSLGYNADEVLANGRQRNSWLPVLDSGASDQTKGMDSMSVAADSFLNEIEKVLAVGVLKENVVAAVAAQRRVVQGAGVMDSRLGGHAIRRIFRNLLKIKTSKTCSIGKVCKIDKERGPVGRYFSKRFRTFAAICRSVILSMVSTPTIRPPSLFLTRRFFSSPLASPGPKTRIASASRMQAITAS